MSYLLLDTNSKSFLRYNLREFGINYKCKKAKVKKIDGGSFSRKVADINREHIVKLIKAIKNRDTKNEKGLCMLIHTRNKLRITKEILRKFDEFER